MIHDIRATLPDIKQRITSQLQKYNAELHSFGGPLGDGNTFNIVLSIITEFTNEFRIVIDGNTNDLSLNELPGGTRTSFVFHELSMLALKRVSIHLTKSRTKIIEPSSTISRFVLSFYVAIRY